MYQEEAYHFQCIADDPWAREWRALTVPRRADTWVVLTRSLSPLHWAITVVQYAAAHLHSNRSGELQKLMEAYSKHVAQAIRRARSNARRVHGTRRM